jgi:hypothetical protein
MVLIPLLPSRTISLAMDIFIPYVSDLRRLISLKYLRLKCKISIMLKLKWYTWTEAENIMGGIFLMDKFPVHLQKKKKKMAYTLNIRCLMNRSKIT